MRNILETLIFLASAVCAMVLRLELSQWWPNAIQVILSIAYWLVIREKISAVSSGVDKIYRNNAGMLFVAAILCLYQPATFVIAFLLVMIAVVIAIRSIKFGGPLPKGEAGPKLLQQF